MFLFEGKSCSHTARPGLIFAKSRTTTAGILGLLAAFVCLLLFASHVFEVPLNPRGAQIRGLPVMALLVSVPTSLMLVPASKVLEAGSRRAVVMRLTWASLLGTIISASVAASAYAVDASGVLLAVRNSLGGFGLVLITATFVGLRVAWLPTLAVAAVTFILGVDYQQIPYGWAVTLAPGSDLGPLLGSVALVVGGIAFYAIRDVIIWDEDPSH